MAPFTPPMTPPQDAKKNNLPSVPTLPTPAEYEQPADINIPDNYVAYTLKNQKALPPVTWENLFQELNYLSLSILTITPAIAIYGAFTTELKWQTGLFAVFYYFVTGLGE